MKRAFTVQPVGQGSQRGITLLGLLFWGVMAASVAILLAKLAPVVNEYRTIQGIVNKMAKEGGSSVPEVRASFDRFKTVEYGVESISGRDLEITKEDDKIVVKFAYDKEVELFSPVFLLIKFEGQSR